MELNPVVTDIEYLKRLPLYRHEKPFQIFIPIQKDAKDQRATNLEFEPKQQSITDIRTNPSSFTVDSHGFQFQKSLTKLNMNLFNNRYIVETEYLPEVERILKNMDSSIDRVFFFDWRVSIKTAYARIWIGTFLGNGLFKAGR